MIDITPYQQKLEWLKEFMSERIKYMGLEYGFKSWTWIPGHPRVYYHDVFNDFCALKEMKQKAEQIAKFDKL